MGARMAGWRTGVARRAILTGALALLPALTACDDDPAGLGEREVRTVEVGPAGQAVVVGDTVRFTATARAADGSTVDDVQVQWTTGDDEVATVTGQGGTALVRAVGVGNVLVKASAGGRWGMVYLSVAEAPPVPVTIEITPSAPTVEVGGEIILTAVLKTAEDEVVEGHEITWSSQRPWIAAVQEGDVPGQVVVTALQPGAATIVARGAGLENGMQVTVTSPEPVAATLEVTPAAATVPEGQEIALQAVLRAADGSALHGRPITWTSQAPATASVTPIEAPGHAVVAGHDAGTATIVARAEGLEASAVVTVTPALVLSGMEMRPDTLVLETNVTATLGVHAWGPDGAWFPDPPATWVNFDPTVVSVIGSGPTAQVTGLREGTARIVASAGGASATAIVIVRDAGPVGQVVVTPTSAGVWKGSLYRLTARVLDTNGVEMSGHPVAWSVEDASVATIEADGLMLTLEPGTTRVFARSGGKEGVSTIRVYATPTGRMVLDLSPQEAPTGEWRPEVALPDTTWTDPTGATHTAHRFLVGGVLDIGETPSRWTQTLEVETVVVLATGPKVVSRTTLADHGTFGYGWDDPWRFHYRSEETPTYTFESRMIEAGRMIVRQAVAGAPLTFFVWLLR